MVNTDTLLRDPNKFLRACRRYSFDPASEPVGRVFGATREANERSKYAGMEHNLVRDDQRIAHCKLTQKTQHTINGGACGAASAIVVSAQFEQAAGYEPAWFLPWNDKGGVVEMTIPAGGGPTDPPSPSVFFTAALSGCSVVFKGTAQNPTILHGGSGTAPIPYDANRFWRDFVNYLAENPTRATEASNTGRIAAQVVKNQYVVGETVQVSPTRTAQTTRHALDFRTLLEKHYGDKVQILEVIPWGAVVGARIGTAWEFYLQENCNLVYYPTRKIQQVMAHTSLSDRTQAAQKIVREAGPPRIVSRPMAFTKVFPGGGGTAQLRGRWRSLLRSDQLPDLPQAYVAV